MMRMSKLPIGYWRSGISSAIVFLGLFVGVFRDCSAQTIQLPTVSFFNVQTVVNVPDGGTIGLGGIGRFSEGYSNRGVPGLGNIPFAGRLFRNQAIGSESSTANASVHVQIISLREYEEALLAQHAADQGNRENRSRTLGGRSVDPDGTHDIKKKANFISDNIGRKR